MSEDVPTTTTTAMSQDGYQSIMPLNDETNDAHESNQGRSSQHQAKHKDQGFWSIKGPVAMSLSFFALGFILFVLLMEQRRHEEALVTKSHVPFPGYSRAHIISEYEQVSNLLSKMHFALDARDWDTYTNSYMNPLVFDDYFQMSPQNYTDTIIKPLILEATATHHQLGNIWIEFETEKKGYVQAYLTATLMYDNNNENATSKSSMSIYSMYNMTVKKRYNEWKIYRATLTHQGQVN